MTTKSTFNWGLIGPGRIAQQFAQATQADFVGQLKAVASRDITRANQFAQQYKVEKVYDDYQALLADPELDAIYIATPHKFHYEQIKMCLQAKKSVVCEKPLTVNQVQAEELFELAKAQNVFLMEAMWTLFLPVYQIAKQWIQNGKIGELKLVQSSFGFNQPKSEQDRWLNRDLAGGVLLDMGVYNVTTSDWLINQSNSHPQNTQLEMPQKIQAMGTVGATLVDEFTVVNMQYQNNQFAQFNCNFDAKTENALWAYGTKGRIKIENMFWCSNSISFYPDNQDEATEIIKQPFAVNGFEYEIAEAEKCIQSGQLQSQVASHAQTRQQLKIMDKIREQLGVTYPFAGE
ncbi:Gfo/Idh/MocA family oxidoreductase [Catenovulum sp. 2E275]|uniref:Gfo/Idh/MocA family protein n=1 Tax=Catenovulum sp. 2E275 TaxID=2980497 RepID=UPI0021D074B9|nr:Gfo/Idh/MocA family oxidoreductase [Catenovulum sp. 2E275]MCU4677237.1 Gfo/Idh/MocA family oxidoreductase [Catenovulum sp. 2E275]